VLDEHGEVVFEHKLSTTPKALREVFGAMPHSRVALETGTHSPWVSRLMKEADLISNTLLGHYPGSAAPLLLYCPIEETHGQ
jgi:hypothetical protein